MYDYCVQNICGMYKINFFCFSSVDQIKREMETLKKKGSPYCGNDEDTPDSQPPTYEQAGKVLRDYGFWLLVMLTPKKGDKERVISAWQRYIQ